MYISWRDVRWLFIFNFAIIGRVIKRFQKVRHLFNCWDCKGRIFTMTLHHRFKLGSRSLICEFTCAMGASWAFRTHGTPRAEANPSISKLLNWAIIERLIIQVMIPFIQWDLLLPVKFGLLSEYKSFLRFILLFIIGWAWESISLLSCPKIVRATFFPLTERIVFFSCFSL